MIITSPYRCGCAFEVRPACSLSPLNCCHPFCNPTKPYFSFMRQFCPGDRWQEKAFRFNPNCARKSPCHNSTRHHCPTPCNKNQQHCNNFQNDCICQLDKSLENAFFFLAGMLLSQKHLH